MLSILKPSLIIILGIGGLIFVHELGHFLTAKWAGVKVEEFSIGFGWAVASFQKGETVYNLRPIPLGGYVRMAGEVPDPEERTGAEYELHSKPKWKRLIIFSAGAGMNFLVAIPLCIAMFWLGLQVPINEVGMIRPDSAEWKTGMQIGDDLKSYRIGDSKSQPITSLRDYQEAVLSTGSNQTLHLKIEREGQTQNLELSPGDQLQPGIDVPSNVVHGTKPESPADRSGIQPGDQIVRLEHVQVHSVFELTQTVNRLMNPRVQYIIDRDSGNKSIESVFLPLDTPFVLERKEGASVLLNPTGDINLKKTLNLDESDRIERVVFAGKSYDIDQHRTAPSKNKSSSRVVSTPDRTLQATVRRNGEKRQVNFEFTEKDLKKNQYSIKSSTIIQPIINLVQNGSPAWNAGLRKGSKIQSISDQKMSSWFRTKEWIQLHPSTELPIKYRKSDKLHESTITPTKHYSGEGRIGVTVQSRQSPHPIRDLPQFSVLKKAGLKNGDVIIGYQKPEGRMITLEDSEQENSRSYKSLLTFLRGDLPSTILLRVRRKEENDTTIKEIEVPLRKIRKPVLGLQLTRQKKLRKYGFTNGIKEGFKEAWRMVTLTIGSLNKVISSSESSGQALKGPVGIIQISYQEARRGIDRFLFLLAVISISLAILNLLPMPPLDGGHILFLFLEAIKGEPVDYSVQATFQAIGLILLLGVFLWVTYYDVVSLL